MFIEVMGSSKTKGYICTVKVVSVGRMELQRLFVGGGKKMVY